LEIENWELEIGNCAQSPIPNPQSPIPNPQSPILINKLYKKLLLINKYYKNLLLINKL